MKAYVLSAALFLLACSPAQADLIVNGSFENFTVGPNDVDFGTFVRFFSPPPNTDITGWTISGSSSGNPNNVDLVHSSLWPAFAGTQSLDMEGAVGASGVIFQSFATTPGDIYDLSFEYSNNPYGSGGAMNVLVTGSGTLLNQNVSHNASTVGNMDYKLFSQTFTAKSAMTTLQFSALTNSGFGVVIDAVSVNPTSVPEPSTLALLAAGIALLKLHKRTHRP
jgi:choice-of-anchor C domain-containing protein